MHDSRCGGFMLAQRSTCYRMCDTTSVTLYLVLTMLRILSEIRSGSRKVFLDEKFVDSKTDGIINIFQIQR